jgi:hypothetical protein
MDPLDAGAECEAAGGTYEPTAPDNKEQLVVLK